MSSAEKKYTHNIVNRQIYHAGRIVSKNIVFTNLISFSLRSIYDENLVFT